MEDSDIRPLKDLSGSSSVGSIDELGSSVSNIPNVPRTSKLRALRNLFVCSFAYFLFFSGFFSLTNLQSTMNAEGGVGLDSQAVIYFLSMVSCFIPELMIEKFGTKSTYVIAILLSCPYIASNFQLRFDTMMIASVLYGLASGPLNAALDVYLDEMSTRYAANVEESRENVQAFFFGFYMFFAECSQILGNCVSYFVLVHGKHHTSPQNMSLDCGVNFYPTAANNSNLTPPSDNQRITLIGTFLIMAAMAVFVALQLDPLKNDLKEVKGCYSIWGKFIGAVKQLKNPQQLLLLPISIYCGMQGSFYASEYTAAFIACSWGVHHVGLVSICFGACAALMSILVGPLVKCISQMCTFILAAVIDIVVCSLLFVWQPSPDVPWAYFVFAGIWGLTDAIWWSQVGALYGLMFPNDREAAFSNFFFWSFMGYFLNYSYANHLNVAMKIYILLTFLIIGVAFYIAGQIKIKCSAR